jgi:hypothetical protein
MAQDTHIAPRAALSGSDQQLWSLWPQRRSAHEAICPIGGGSLREGDDILGPSGAHLLRRRKDGELVAEPAQGKAISLVPASCRGKLLAVHRERGVLVVCARGVAEGARGRVEMHGPTIHRALGFDTYVPKEEILDPTSGRLIEVVYEETLVDMEKGARVPVPRKSHVFFPLLAGELEVNPGPRFAAYRDEKLYFHDAETGAEKLLGPLTFSGRPPDLHAGPMAAIGGQVIDTRDGRILGRFTGESMAITVDGRVLVAPAKSEDDWMFTPVGPLHWIAADPGAK